MDLGPSAIRVPTVTNKYDVNDYYREYLAIDVVAIAFVKGTKHYHAFVA